MMMKMDAENGCSVGFFFFFFASYKDCSQVALRLANKLTFIIGYSSDRAAAVYGCIAPFLVKVETCNLPACNPAAPGSNTRCLGC